MRVFTRTLAGDLRRTLLTATAVAAIVASALAYVSNYIEDLLQDYPLYVLNAFASVSSGTMSQLTLLLCALPCATIFCTDWNTQFIKFSYVRSKPYNYSLSKVLACAVTAALVVAASQLLFVGLLSLKSPFVNAAEDLSGYLADLRGFDVFWRQDNIFLYMASHILVKALWGAFYAVCALWASTKIPNLFVVLAMPILLHYLVFNAHYYVPIPQWADPELVVVSGVDLGSPGLSLLYAVLYFCVLIGLVGFFFSRGVNRRVARG